VQVSGPEVQAPPRGRLGRGVKLALGLLISAVFLYGLLAAVPFAKVVDVLAGARPQWIAAALGCLLVGYLLKIYRWTIMLRSLGAKVGISDTAAPFLGGVAFNNVLPLRAGDVIRVVAFQRFTGVPASGQLGSLLLERLLDLLVLMVFLFATISFWQITALDGTMLSGARFAALAVAAAIVMFIAAPRAIRLVVRWAEDRLPRLRPAGEALLRLSEAVGTLSRPLFLARVTAISILAWLAEGGAFLMVGLALGVAPTVPAALLAVSIGTLSTIIPSSPGYVGTFHYFTAKAVSVFGAGEVGAAAYAILIHALLWVSTTASGFLLLALSGFGARRATPAAQAGE
jgi:uncharacterized protein (TIRG00374 family)